MMMMIAVVVLNRPFGTGVGDCQYNHLLILESVALSKFRFPYS